MEPSELVPTTRYIFIRGCFGLSIGFLVRQGSLYIKSVLTPYRRLKGCLHSAIKQRLRACAIVGGIVLQTDMIQILQSGQ